MKNRREDSHASAPIDSFLPMSRRQLLQAGGLGIGSLALQFLFHTEAARAESTASIPIDLRPKRPNSAGHGRSLSF